MITYINDLFLTDKTAKKIDKIKKDIENRKWLSKVCLIILASNDNDVFDIIQLFNLRTSKDIYDNITVIGIAENKGAAIEMCAELSNEYLTNTDNDNKNSTSMREYFINHYINR